MSLSLLVNITFSLWIHRGRVASMIAFGLRGPMFDPSGWQKFFSTEYIIDVWWILGFRCKQVWRFGKNDVFRSNVSAGRERGIKGSEGDAEKEKEIKRLPKSS